MQPRHDVHELSHHGSTCSPLRSHNDDDDDSRAGDHVDWLEPGEEEQWE